MPQKKSLNRSDDSNVVGATNNAAVWLAGIGLVLALAAALMGLTSGIGYRLGGWDLRTGIAMIRWAFWIALAAIATALGALAVARSPRPPATLLSAFLGLAIAGATAYVPWNLWRTLKSVPPIHDITTDTENPPAFVAAAALRKPGDHSPAYAGPAAEQQRQAYPDIAPLIVKASKEDAFDAARSALTAMGLEIIDADPSEGRLEATDTSLLFGFKDDLVVRVTGTAEGTRIDVRSQSRMGRSDLGVNAKRVRTFLRELGARLEARR